MYQFIKIKINKYGDEFNDWFFSPKTIAQVEEHWEKYAAPQLKQTMLCRYDDARDALQTMISGINTTETVGDVMNDLCGFNIKELKQRRLDLFNTTNILLLTREGQCIEIPNDLITIIQSTSCETLEFPE